MIITTGNGGMVLTENSKHYSQMRDMRNGGDTINLNCTMTDFQGAMGISQAQKIKNFIKRRQDIARNYYEAIRITSHRTPYHFSENFAYQGFPVIFDAPVDKIEKYWKKNGIEIISPFKNTLHSLSGLRGMDFPNGDRLSKKLFLIPLYPTLTKNEIEKVSKSLARFI